MSSGTSQQRRLAVATAAMFILAAGISGSFFYLKNQAAASPEVPSIVVMPDGTFEQPGYDPEVEKALRQVRINRAISIRRKFQPWALRHKQLIQTMLSAAPTDQAALMAVYDAVPDGSLKAGLHPKELGGGKPPFSWGSLEKTAKPDDYARLGAQFKKAIEYGRKIRLERFADFRDMVVSDSVNSGRYSVQLWVSGRITETRAVGGQDGRPGRVGLAEDIKEIMPPYDFLKSTIRANAKAVVAPKRARSFKQ